MTNHTSYNQDSICQVSSKNRSVNSSHSELVTCEELVTWRVDWQPLWWRMCTGDAQSRWAFDGCGDWRDDTWGGYRRRRPDQLWRSLILLLLLHSAGLRGLMVACSTALWEAPFPQIDIIGAVVIVWRARGKTIRSVLCNIVCNKCAQCDAYTHEQTNSSLDWVLSHWAHFTVLRLIFVLCITVCCMHA